jgi:hypothetical protein
MSRNKVIKGDSIKVQDTPASVEQFKAGLNKLAELLDRPGNTVAIVIVSDGRRVSAGMAGSAIDIMTTLNPGYDAVVDAVKKSVSAVSNG